MRRFSTSGTDCSEMPPCERSGASRPGEIVLGGRPAEGDKARGDHDEVADAVRRQLEAARSLGAGQHRLDAAQAGDARNQCRHVDIAGQVDGGVGAQGAVVHDVRIGDRQDDARAGGAQPPIQHVLQVDHVRARIEPGLGVHAVIGGERDGAAQGIELAQVAVHHAVEGIGLLGARGVLVLHVVGGREVHDILGLRLHEPARRRRTRTPTAPRCRRPAPACPTSCTHALDAVLGKAHLVGLLGGEADALELVAEELAQLVLGGDDRDLARRGRRGPQAAWARAATSGRSSSPRRRCRCRRGSCRRCRAPQAARR